MITAALRSEISFKDFDIRTILNFDIKPTLNFDIRPTLNFYIRSTLNFDIRPTLNFDVRSTLNFDIRPTLNSQCSGWLVLVVSCAARIRIGTQLTTQAEGCSLHCCRPCSSRIRASCSQWHKHTNTHTAVSTSSWQYCQNSPAVWTEHSKWCSLVDGVICPEDGVTSVAFCRTTRRINPGYRNLNYHI